jgi:hypothetical protein
VGKDSSRVVWNKHLKPVESYLRQSRLDHLKLSSLSFGEIQTMLRNHRITDEIYSHLVTLSSVRDSDLDIVQTKLDKKTFNSLVFLDGFPTAELISEGRTILQVTNYVEKTYPSKEGLKTLFSKDPWFDRVRPIYEVFEYDKFSPLILAVPATDKETTHGLLCVKDGCHRSFTLGIKVNNESFDYEEVDVIIIYYNREKYDILL